MRFTLRKKLALISLLLLFIPFAGLRFSDIIKQDLLTSQEQTLLFSARVVASALAGHTGLFAREQFLPLIPGNDLYLHKLDRPMRLNGKIDDWQTLLKEADHFGPKHLLAQRAPYDPESLSFTHLTGIRGDFLYALFIVTDDQIVYRRPNSLRLDQSDHLELVFEDKQESIRRYLLTVRKPGWVNGFLILDQQEDNYPVKVEPRIQGMWVETSVGYTIEIRIPASMIGEKLAFTITDIDDPESREKKYIIGTATAGKQHHFNRLLSSSDSIDTILASMSRPQARTLIVDRNQRVRASHGDLDFTVDIDGKNQLDSPQSSILSTSSRAAHSLLSPLYNLFINSLQTITSGPEKLSTLDLAGVEEALEGKSTIVHYRPPNGNIEIMAAITPLAKDGQVVGAVVVEQTTNSILALQNRVIEESLTLTILVFGVGGLGLLLFASRLSVRIRRLDRETARAIRPGGKIVANYSAIHDGDEVGELSRSLSSMLGQLRIQAEFREKMADNLEHEIRTPLAGISASLKNLNDEIDNPPPHLTKYLNWAMKDVNRLESLLTAIRDATCLQEVLEADQKEHFDLGIAIGLWLENNWEPAFEGVQFDYLRPASDVTFYGDPARIHQMLDKLVENAVAFHTPQTPVTITLTKQPNTILISVSNVGVPIPEEIQPQIFNSMISHRVQKDNKPHLGLGLYIVRTIVEKYQGAVQLQSEKDQNLTTFSVSLSI